MLYGSARHACKFYVTAGTSLGILGYVALMGHGGVVVLLGGLLALIVAVLLHAINIWGTIIGRKSWYST